MRNLKKFLALVLALMMVVSVMITVSAKEFTDKDKIGEDYEDAVDALTNIGVFKGTSKTEDTFNPEGKITRAEVAAIVYRIMTGDVKDENVELYRGYDNDFIDVPETAWYAPYVNYCNNARLLLGDGKGHFYPTKEINGYQVLAVLLRCLGYTQPGQFEGTGWEIKTSEIAASQHITDDLGADLAGVLERQQVAFLTYNAALVAQRVRYTSAFGYTTFDIDGTKLGQLIDVDDEDVTFEQDKWGAPKDATCDVVFTAPIADVTLKKGYTVSAPEPDDEFWTPKTECDVAEAIGLDTNTNFTVYTNGLKNAANGSIEPLATKADMGGYGRWTRVYKDAKRIVYVDTLLARVDKVTKHTEDAAGHVDEKATLTLNVYAADAKSLTGGTKVTLSQKTDYNYSEGDMLLVNYIQKDEKTSDVYVGAALSSTYGTAGKSGSVTDKDNAYVYVDKAPTAKNGTQSVIYYNTNKHNVDGVDVYDNLRFHLNETNNAAGTYTWYYDAKGYLIGATQIANVYSYGIIKNIWWAGDAADGSGAAKATVVYMDGTETVITLGRVTAKSSTMGTGSMNEWTLWSGVPTYSRVNSDVMTIPGDGKFYVATNAATNAELEPQDTDDNAGILNPRGHGIIAGHLFRFTQMANGSYLAEEVAGTGSDGVIPYRTDRGTVAPTNYNGLANTWTPVKKGQSTNGALLIDDNTMFLVRSGNGTTVSPYVYTPVTGYKNIKDYDANQVDYVNTDSDPYAEYVYILAPASDAENVLTFYTSDYVQNGLDYKWGTTYSQTVNAAGETVYTLSGYVDGVYGTVQTKTKSIVDTITAYSTAQNQLWVLHTTNGVVDAIVDQLSGGTGDPANATPFDMTTTAYSAVDSIANGMYKNVSTVKLTGDDKDIWNAGAFYDDSAKTSYDITEKSIVIGDTSNLNGKQITLVYNNTTKAIVLAYVVKPDKTSGTPSTPPTTTPTSITVELVNGTGYTNLGMPAEKKVTLTTGTTKYDGFSITFPIPTTDTNLMFKDGKPRFVAVTDNDEALAEIEMANDAPAGYYKYNIRITGLSTKNVTVTLTLNKDLGKTLSSLKTGETVTIPAGAGTVTAPEKIAGNVKLAKGAKLTFSSESTMTGGLEMEEGSEIDIDASSNKVVLPEPEGEGTIKVTNGTVVFQNGTGDTAKKAPIGEDITLDVEGGSVTVGAIEGTVTVASSGSLTADEIAEGADVVVSKGATVTIKEWNTSARVSETALGGSKGSLDTEDLEQGLYHMQENQLSVVEAAQNKHTYVIRVNNVGAAPAGATGVVAVAQCGTEELYCVVYADTNAANKGLTVRFTLGNGAGVATYEKWVNKEVTVKVYWTTESDKTYMTQGWEDNITAAPAEVANSKVLFTAKFQTNATAGIDWAEKYTPAE